MSDDQHDHEAITAAIRAEAARQGVDPDAAAALIPTGAVVIDPATGLPNGEAQAIRALVDIKPWLEGSASKINKPKPKPSTSTPSRRLLISSPTSDY